MKDDKFTINVTVNGFKMPLNIPRKDEELYRNAEKLVEKYINHFQKQYNQHSTEQILIIVAFQIAVIVSKQEISEDVVPLADKIQALDDELKALLNRK